MTDHKCGLIYDPLFSKHITGIGHPEQPGRVTKTYKSLQKAGLTDLCRELTPYEAEEKNSNKSIIQIISNLPKKI